jgi:cytochrome b561
MKYSLPFRIWHWLNAFVVLGLLGTVFLRKTFLSWRTNSEILMQKLSEMNIEVTTEQAKILAKAIRAGMWEWHIILGYSLAFLVIYRGILFMKDSSIRVSFENLSLHKKAVKMSYFVFYAVLLFMTLSGLTIHFYEVLGMSKDFAHDIKEVHEAVYNFFLVFVPLHIAGVLVAEHRDEAGLISTMINGKS